MAPGAVVWITGLSGAGKSTLAEGLTSRLRRTGKPVVMLDGDLLREALGISAEQSANYDRRSRCDVALKYSRICRLIACQGTIVVISTISMFKEVYNWNRKNLPSYFEVYLKVSMKELQRRDSKGIYKRFADGELKNIAGVDISIDEPAAPDFLIETDELDITSIWADMIFQKMKKRKLV